MNCPVDGATLRSLEVSRRVVLTCDRCRGIWLSQETLCSLAEQSGQTGILVTSPARVGTRPSSHSCPVCHPHRLEKLPARSVELEVCPNCHGVWLDAGELEQVVSREPHRRPPAGLRESKGTRVRDGLASSDSVVEALIEVIPAGLEAGAAGVEAVGEFLLEVIVAIAP